MLNKISHWPSNNINDFFRHHIFLDQINSGLNVLLEDPTKYPLRYQQNVLSVPIVQQLLKSITVADDITYDTVLEFNYKLE